MLRINDIKMDLDLTVVGYVREGAISCTRCGGPRAKSDRLDPLYGKQGDGFACDTCRTPLAVQVKTAVVA